MDFLFSFSSFQARGKANKGRRVREAKLWGGMRRSLALYKYSRPAKIKRIEKSLLLLKIRRIEKSSLLLKIRRIEKSLLLLKIRRIEKSLLLLKIWRICEILAFTENQADDRILAGVEISAPGKKPLFEEKPTSEEKLAGLEKHAACLLFRLGGISSC